MSSKTPVQRPLSPHLQIYKPLINMVMSIFHRMSGAALYFGMLFMAWWLISVASGPQYLQVVQDLMISIPGRLALFGFSWALIHHSLGGLRHFIWDTGRGFELGTVNLLSWMTIIGSIVLTLAIWTLGYHIRGAF